MQQPSELAVNCKRIPYKMMRKMYAIMVARYKPANKKLQLFCRNKLEALYRERT